MAFNFISQPLSEIFETAQFPVKASSFLDELPGTVSQQFRPRRIDIYAVRYSRTADVRLIDGRQEQVHHHTGLDFIGSVSA